ncbi:MAG: T9SS type A sorting domain-containing protein, partial [Bacteroidota bacterium]
SSEINQHRIILKIADADFIGDTINLLGLSYIENQEGILELANTYNYRSVIRCAYDPNDKLVRPNRSQEYDKNYTLFDEALEYNVRFQNTGNDTAFTVIIRDQLAENLDWTTFKPITASHDFETHLHKDGLVEFIFKNILLPDSTTNEAFSHGFVSYQIKAQSALAEHTAIANTASIYFDANPPIITNTTQNVMVSELPKITSTENLSLTKNFKFYPNPTCNILDLKIEEVSLPSLEVHFYNFSGQRLKIFQGISTFDLSNFSKGIYLAEIWADQKVVGREKIVVQ